MKKEVNLKKFIIFQTLLMLLISIFYFYLVPKIKPMCNSRVKCADAFDCVCKNATCQCKRYNSNGDIEAVECPDISQSQK